MTGASKLLTIEILSKSGLILPFFESDTENEYFPISSFVAPYVSPL